jgi:hypothetical protein
MDLHSLLAVFRLVCLTELEEGPAGESRGHPEVEELLVAWISTLICIAGRSPYCG